ncbi:ABC transporter substrate-binding protein [Streptomyces triticirhizae]|uniref:Nitrate ABC transporter substrate-binding protein n=1 Tax=Streptomyces triticirhizae TaxID=2483353 RepID=A0A3M2LTG7_9ACTN|nr:ABC transporter substrate-binding protein [Streptomyces triticirhizae]RMI40781.1 nitrate ABC transporter substrate-binding protein [Streptomyces triticirhizae]
MNHQLPKTGVAAALGLLLTAALAGCGTSKGEDGGSSDTITIGTLRSQPHLYQPYLMERFAEEGVSYQITTFDNSPDIKNALSSGAIDFAVLGAPSMLAGSAAGEGIRIIGSAANGGSGFVGGPEIAGPEDLPGTSIGYPAGSSQEILLKLTLRANGIDPDSDVELVNLPYADMAPAYESGQVDAFLGAETGVSIALEAGAHEIVSPYDTPIGGVNIVFGTRAELVENDPELVQSVTDVFIQAVGLMNEEPETWVDGVVETFGLDPEVTARSVTNITPRYALDEDYLTQLAAQAEQMVAFDQISGEPDLETLVDPTFVEASAFAE